MSIIDARVIQKIGTEAEWNANELILLKGELALVAIDDLVVNMKVGNGTKKFRELPYIYTGGFTDSVTPTTQGSALIDGMYIANGAGIYTNMGSVIVKENYFTIISKVGTAYKIASEVKMPETDLTEIESKISVIEDALTTKLEITPSLTSGKYINNQGILTNTTGAISATEEFINLQGANRLEYYGLVGSSNTKIALYKTAFQSLSEVVSLFPQDNTPIEYLNIEVPTEAKYIRATCFDSAIENFKIVLHLDKEFYKEILNDFTIYGTPTYDANNVITTANIVWNDGSKGVITYNTWNEQEFTYTGFVATSVERNIRVTQSPVTFDSNGKITNYPILTYTNL